MLSQVRTDDVCLGLVKPRTKIIFFFLISRKLRHQKCKQSNVPIAVEDTIREAFMLHRVPIFLCLDSHSECALIHPVRVTTKARFPLPELTARVDG